MKDTCLRFPMMAERQVVIVRELQNWRIDALEKLEPYFAETHAHHGAGAVLQAQEGRWSKEHPEVHARKVAAQVFLSDKVRDDKLPDLLISFAKNQKRKLGSAEAALLATHLGSDLAKAMKEVEKLCLVTEEGGAITSDIIQRFVGISKDYNIFELQNAIGTRDAVEGPAHREPFRGGPEGQSAGGDPWFPEHLFRQAGTWCMQRWARASAEMASALKVSPYFVKDYVAHARNYSLAQGGGGAAATCANSTCAARDLVVTAATMANCFANWWRR